jgi:hypothetical protein
MNNENTINDISFTSDDLKSITKQCFINSVDKVANFIIRLIQCNCYNLATIGCSTFSYKITDKSIVNVLQKYQSSVILNNIRQRYLNLGTFNIDISTDFKITISW